jgi:hypothetical protein
MSKLFIPYDMHNDIPCVKHNLFEKACYQKSEHVFKVGKFSALDLLDVQSMDK